MSLPDLWFFLICVLWTGYFVLEGFDFGVGMLLRVLGRDDADRDALVETIGPFWDGNEVWLITAVGATFAAFPVWYATMFSGFYILFLLLLFVLILRGVSFEWRERVNSPRARVGWTWANTLASVAAPLLWGIVFANLLHGVPINGSQDYAGNFGDLFSGYTVLAGVALVVLFAFHGSVFLGLRTTGDLRRRARELTWPLGLVSAIVVAAFLIWSVVIAHDTNERGYAAPAIAAAIALVALLAGIAWARRGRETRAFVATSLGVAATIVTVFVSLFPRVMVSSPTFANSLTVDNASSAHYTLQVITIATAVLLPLILLYQSWTYRVFRARIEGRDPGSPIDVLGPKRSGDAPT
jgi:cytochrome bd ubiquinol oxidase subunit II